MSAPGTPKASGAAIAAVQNALGCEPNPWSTKGGRGVPATMPDGEIWSHCSTHHGGARWTERGCPVAVAAADAGAPWIAAQTLRDAASAWQSGEGFTVMTPRLVGIPAIDYSQRTLDWLRERADRIEAGQ